MIDWFDLAIQGTIESSPAPQFESISSLVLNLVYDPTLTSIRDYGKNHSFDYRGLPGGPADKESTCNAGDLGSIPGLGRSPGEGKGYPFQYSGLENTNF